MARRIKSYRTVKFFIFGSPCVQRKLEIKIERLSQPNQCIDLLTNQYQCISPSQFSNGQVFDKNVIFSNLTTLTHMTTILYSCVKDVSFCINQAEAKTLRVLGKLADDYCLPGFLSFVVSNERMIKSSQTKMSEVIIGTQIFRIELLLSRI